MKLGEGGKCHRGRAVSNPCDCSFLLQQRQFFAGGLLIGGFATGIGADGIRPLPSRELLFVGVLRGSLLLALLHVLVRSPLESVGSGGLHELH